ncbi:ABC transporter permease [Mycolicibacterium sp. lyk4-40-TYG-92]|uniref:MlaE family ABC transporter permease n=1 Tax=Mycolicibacterium sp. lyk4-40-TYG-92 TaxID=3040295 RepID=UPI002550B9AA|nr:ABC transporter permease [Mycolicibacterium sp. lyk4-40-TYG-92]
MAAPSAFLETRRSVVRTIRQPLIEAGQWALFIGTTLWYLPLTLRRYYRQTLQAMNSLAWGRGSLIVDGGTISVLLFLGIAVGASVAIEGFAILNLIGFGAMSGIIGGVGTVREIGPLVAGIAFTSQAGCRMTAEIGAMRISEEIDALEVLGLRPIPFVVGTRLIGGLLVVIPGYLLTMVAAFYVQSTFIKVFYDQPGGTYDHYLSMFLTPTDLVYSAIKASTFCIAVTLIHCYYGYFTSGGPAGVGQASGRAVRTSLVAVMILDFALTVALWGLQPQFVFRG